MCGASQEPQVAALEAVIHAVEDGTLPLKRVEDALARHRRVKERFLAPPRPRPLDGRGAARGARPRRASGDCRRDGEVRLARCASRARLRPGDRVAVVAPASPFARDEFDAGVAEIRALGFEPVYEESVFARHGYVAGPPDVRAAAFAARLGRTRRSPRSSPPAAATAASRCCRCSIRRSSAGSAKAFIGYSDNTSILTWLTLQCGIVSFHGPMIEGRLAPWRGRLRSRHVRALPLPRRAAWARSRTRSSRRHAPGEARGMLVGGTLTQLTGVARHAVRVRRRLTAACCSSTKSASARIRLDRHADAAAAERAARRGVGGRLRRAAAVRRARRRSDGARRRSRSRWRTFPGRCCSACRPATRRARR